MIGIVVWVLPWVFSLLSFWLPLLLSVKALANPVQHQLHFLLTYWLLYIVQLYVQKILFGLLPVPIWRIAFDFLSLWMFYCRGCLVLASHFLPDAMRSVSGFTSFAQFESVWLDPQGEWIVRHKETIVRFASCLPKSVSNPIILFTKEAKKSYAAGTRSLLLFGLAFFCYPELAQEVKARVVLSQRVLDSLRPGKRGEGKRWPAPPLSDDPPAKVSGARLNLRAASYS